MKMFLLMSLTFLALPAFSKGRVLSFACEAGNKVPTLENPAKALIAGTVAFENVNTQPVVTELFVNKVQHTGALVEDYSSLSKLNSGIEMLITYGKMERTIPYHTNGGVLDTRKKMIHVSLEGCKDSYYATGAGAWMYKALPVLYSDLSCTCRLN